MNEDRLNELLEQCKSPIESELLKNLYPHLTADRGHVLRAQYRIDRYDDVPVTIPDFAFPDMQIAIYCDGFKWHESRKAFKRDRLQSRELQLQDWIVLRFAGSEIKYDSEMVVETIQRAIARRDGQRTWRSQQQQKHQNPLVLHSGPARQWKHQTQQKPEGGFCGVIFLAGVVIGAVVLLNLIF